MTERDSELKEKNRIIAEMALENGDLQKEVEQKNARIYDLERQVDELARMERR